METIAIIDLDQALKVLPAIERSAAETAPWATGAVNSASRDDVVSHMIATSKDWLTLADNERAAINGFLETLVAHEWVRNDVTQRAQERLERCGVAAGTARARAAAISANVIAAAGPAKSSDWAVDEEDCPLQDLLLLTFRRVAPLLGVMARVVDFTRREVLTDLRVGARYRKGLRENSFKGGSGQPFIRADIDEALTSRDEFERVLVDDVTPFVERFMADRIVASRKNQTQAWIEPDRQVFERRVADLAVEYPGLDDALALAGLSPSERRAAAGAWRVPLRAELDELFAYGPKLALKYHVRVEDVDDVVQDSGAALCAGRTDDGAVLKGYWRVALSTSANAVKKHYAESASAYPADVEAVDRQVSFRERRLDLVVGLKGLREHFDQAEPTRPVLLIREWLADLSAVDGPEAPGYDHSPQFLWENAVPPWVYERAQTGGFDQDKDIVLRQMRRLLKVAVSELMPDGHGSAARAQPHAKTHEPGGNAGRHEQDGVAEATPSQRDWRA